MVSARHRYAVSRSTLRQCLADAEERAARAERVAADAVARAGRAEDALGVLQGLYDALDAVYQGLRAEHGALCHKLMRGWFEEAQATVAVPAPGDDPASVFWDGGATQETLVVALWDRPGDETREMPAPGPALPTAGRDEAAP